MPKLPLRTKHIEDIPERYRNLYKKMNCLICKEDYWVKKKSWMNRGSITCKFKCRIKFNSLNWQAVLNLKRKRSCGECSYFDKDTICLEIHQMTVQLIPTCWKWKQPRVTTDIGCTFFKESHICEVITT